LDITVTIIDATPVASFVFPGGRLAINEPETFDARGSIDPDGTIASYSWSFDDNSPVASGSVVSHTFTAPGHYMVSLTVTDDAGRSNTVTLDVDIVAPNIIVTTVQVPGCSGSTCTLTIGQKVTITVLILNGGTTDENFTIVAKWGTFTVAQTDATLLKSQQLTFTLTWDTTGYATGTGTLTATVLPVLKETNTTDNTGKGPSLTLAAAQAPFLPGAQLPVTVGAVAAIVLITLGLVIRGRAKKPSAAAT
jgi:PKD repeat protein